MGKSEKLKLVGNRLFKISATPVDFDDLDDSVQLGVADAASVLDLTLTGTRLALQRAGVLEMDANGRAIVRVGKLREISRARRVLGLRRGTQEYPPERRERVFA